MRTELDSADLKISCPNHPFKFLDWFGVSQLGVLLVWNMASFCEKNILLPWAAIYSSSLHYLPTVK